MVRLEPEVILTAVAQLDARDLQAAPLVAAHILDPVPVGQTDQVGVRVVCKVPFTFGCDVEPHDPRGTVRRRIVVPARQDDGGPGPGADVCPGEAHGPSAAPRS